MCNTIDNRLVPNDRPQYRTALDFKSRLSTMIITDVGENIEKHVDNINEMIDGIFTSLNFHNDRSRYFLCEIRLGRKSFVSSCFKGTKDLFCRVILEDVRCSFRQCNVLRSPKFMLIPKRLRWEFE